MLSNESYLERVQKLILQLNGNIITVQYPLNNVFYQQTSYKKGNKVPSLKDGEWTEFKEGSLWGGTPDFHAWFYTKVVITEQLKGKKLRFQFNTDYTGWAFENPQFLVYVNGKIVQGIDQNHRYFEIVGDKDFDLHIYGYTSFDCFRALQFFINVCEIDELTERLYYDLKVPFDVLSFTDKSSKEYFDILYFLNETLKLVDFRSKNSKEYKESIKQATEYFDREFYKGYCKKQIATCTMVGQTHIDVAWLWTFAQTREKAQRSFATVIENMRKYPDYTFFCSQPYLYKAVKEEAPALYDEIKKRVEEGRFEVEGALWLENDTNLPSGESLVRQVLYGKKFFKDEFGVDSHIVWLPDAFGYSAALPQIFKLSGVDTFITSKISWNDRNTMPHDVFTWRGIDGSDVFTYFITCQSAHTQNPRLTTYNADATPDFLAGSYKRFQDKHVSDNVLICYGYGDGGGGPTAEQIETIERMKRGIPGCPNAENGTIDGFIDKIKESSRGKLSSWVGELYLEFHRGTLSAISKNKLYNRKIEFLIHNIEAIATMNKLLNGAQYPYAELEKMWEEILTLQFHDVLPGSSIKEVYDDTDAIYKKLFSKGEALRDKIVTQIAQKAKSGEVVFNMQPFKVNSDLLQGEKYVMAKAPAYGFAVSERRNNVCSVKVADKILENKFFRIKFDDNYEIVSIYDIINGREVLKPNQKGNVLTVYENVSIEYDAWEIRDFYTEKAYPLNDLKKCEFVDLGSKKGIRVYRKFMDSSLKQTILLSDVSPRIDFITDVDWKQENLMLKVKFPVDVFAQNATFDIQFGNIERPIYGNTSWDDAKFETCAHKYVDISENGYGVALLNDCKYGHDVLDGNLGLTLLRSPTYPYKDADQGKHKFTYSLCPHNGRLSESDTLKLAFDLNNPLFAVNSVGSGNLESYSMIECDYSNLVVDTVKMSEDKKGVIVRLYETFRERTDAIIKTGFEFKKVYKCDLRENVISELDGVGESVEIKVKPYEIVTLKFEL